MTNEEIAIQIQLGHTEYYSLLWGKVKKLMHKILYSKTSRLTLPNYITQEDLQQEMYFAFCKAVQAYDDTKPYKFNSYLDFHIMNAIRNALPNSKAVQECSYNKAVGEEEDTELIDLIPDKKSEMPLYKIELTDLQQQVRQAVAELPNRESQAVALHYLHNVNYADIAKLWNCSLNNARERTRKGIQILRRDKRINTLYGKMSAHYEHLEVWERIALFEWQYSKERRAVIEKLLQRQNAGEYISYGTKQSILTIAKQRYIRQQEIKHRDEHRIYGG